MADQTAKGEEFEKKAEKKLAGWGIFGSKYDDAAELFDKAANCFKLAKNCMLPLPSSLFPVLIPIGVSMMVFDGDRAGSVYIKLANCHLKVSILLVLVLILRWQDLADSMDEGDVVKFTNALQEYDSMTRLVSLFSNI
ncbi:hypothetical protein BHE74_00033816 [Ensete ventricosum]|nr:hypothetical protein GW17_00051090 [Ensete ventricosum]RWW59256.1 hypothetical protein BHE74_00033816 [Ensete ventricosum]RZR90977.1 hypothetical protein BHM03_00019001 [Ensete ventricosum]